MSRFRDVAGKLKSKNLKLGDSKAREFKEERLKGKDSKLFKFSGIRSLARRGAIGGIKANSKIRRDIREGTRAVTEAEKRRKKSDKQARRRRERRGRKSLLTPSGSAIGEASTLG